MFLIKWLAVLLYGKDAVDSFEKKPPRKTRGNNRGKR